MPFLTDISPELIDFLIKKEKKEQEKDHEMPFLQLPVPYMPEIEGQNSQKNPQNDQNDDNQGAIIIDL